MQIFTAFLNESGITSGLGCDFADFFIGFNVGLFVGVFVVVDFDVGSFVSLKVGFVEGFFVDWFDLVEIFSVLSIFIKLSDFFITLLSFISIECELFFIFIFVSSGSRG